MKVAKLNYIDWRDIPVPVSIRSKITNGIVGSVGLNRKSVVTYLMYLMCEYFHETSN
jgi:hypothetical protein